MRFSYCKTLIFIIITFYFQLFEKLNRATLVYNFSKDPNLDGSFGSRSCSPAPYSSYWKWSWSLICCLLGIIYLLKPSVIMHVQLENPIFSALWTATPIFWENNLLLCLLLYQWSQDPQLEVCFQMIIDIIQKAIVLHLFVGHYRSASIYSYYIFLLAWSLENQLQLSRS